MEELSKWIFGWEIIPNKWTDAELLSHIRAGLPTYCGTDDRRIHDVDTLPRHKDTIEEIKRNLRKKYSGYFMRREGNRTSYAIRSEINDHDFSRWEPVGADDHPSLTLEAEHIFKTQPGTPIIPPNCYAMPFALPTNRADTLILFDKIKSFKFKRDEVAEYEQTSGLHDTDAIPAAPSANSKDILKAHLSAAGKKGGSRNKIKKPILEAVKNFMQGNDKIRGISNEMIAKKFCNKYSDNKPLTITLDKIKWDIYYSGRLIFFRMAESYEKKANNINDSIAYGTFKKYISLAKKSISTDTSQ